MTLLLAYTRERLLRREVLGVAVLVAMTAQLGRGASSAAIALADLVSASLLVFTFRTWDDVMDRERDRAQHPGRVLVRAATIAPVAVATLAIASLCACTIWLAHGAAAVALLLTFSLVLAAWYGVRGPRSAAGEWLLLSKYGVFTLALIGPRALGWRALIGALGVYLAACVHEWRHDRESRVFSPGGFR